MKRFFSNKQLVFNQVIWLLSSVKAALMARKESQMAIAFSVPPHWRKAQNSFEIIQIVVIRKCYHQNFSPLILRSAAKACGINEKLLTANSAHVKFLRWPFQSSTNFESSTFALGQRNLFLRFCKFSVFDGHFLFTILYCHNASSASSVHGVFVNKKWNPQFFQVFLELELVFLSSSRDCGIRAARFHQMSQMYHLGQCFHFQFSYWIRENLDNESKANPKYFQWWEYIRVWYPTFFD